MLMTLERIGPSFSLSARAEIVVAVADQHGPEAGLLDAVLLPDLDGGGLEPLEQRRQAARQASVHAILVDHGGLR
jgi:hypothetical protein